MIIDFRNIKNQKEKEQHTNKMLKLVAFIKEQAKESTEKHQETIEQNQDVKININNKAFK